MRYRVEQRSAPLNRHVETLYGRTNPDWARVIDAHTGRAMAVFEDWQDADEYATLKNTTHTSNATIPALVDWINNQW